MPYLILLTKDVCFVHAASTLLPLSSSNSTRPSGQNYSDATISLFPDLKQSNAEHRKDPTLCGKDSDIRAGLATEDPQGLGKTVPSAATEQTPGRQDCVTHLGLNLTKSVQRLNTTDNMFLDGIENKTMHFGTKSIAQALLHQRMITKTVTDSTKHEISHSSGGRTVCSAKCNNARFMMRPDGHCKALHSASVAIADDELPPLCFSAQVKLAKFISRGLESRIQTLQHPEFASSTVILRWDPAINKTLYGVTVNVYLPFFIQSSFSDESKDSVDNLYHL
ncbi:hypothetical protein PoB_004204100 [Plakobranchus ocellatus]|uniref:Uncharacterized protein n=1 Tax=Plakobranchus ocellatus TaxID=259542 RepID=A0AAV4AWQ2_9GAST|nr:hypothetical protein PoB_004204100 [Plakobranchus ocellatus]